MKAIVFLCVLIVSPALRAQFSVPWCEVQDLAKLPGHLKAPARGLALLADFEHKDENGTVPVYLINQSGKSIVLETQDGDPYLKLEYQDAEGTWKRAQPHLYSNCGNSYFPTPEVKSGSFVKFQAYQPQKGEEATVRYRLHQQPHKALCVESNSGRGLINLDDIHHATNDAMVLSEGDFEFVSAVALGKITLKNTLMGNSNLRPDAIRRLALPKFDRAKAEAVLQEIAKDKDREMALIATEVQIGLAAEAADAAKKPPVKMEDPFAPPDAAKSPVPSGADPFAPTTK